MAPSNETQTWLILLLLCFVYQITWADTTTASSDQGPSKTENKAAEEFTIESEVLGPLRVWHLVFIVSTVLIIIMVIICCCFDFRIPRTRQEIEESYKKRQANAKYLNYLEKLPTGAMLQNNQQPSDRRITKHSRISTTNTTNRPNRTSNIHTEEDEELKKFRKISRMKVDESTLAEHQAMMAAISKKRHLGESKQRPSTVAMNKSMTSLPRDSDSDTRY